MASRSLLAFPQGLIGAGWDAVRPYAVHAAVVLLACVGVWAVQRNYFLVGDQPVKHPLILAGLVLALLPLRARDISRPLLITHRAIVLLFAFYWLISYTAVSAAYWEGDPFARFLHNEARWVAVAAGLAAWWRPAFGIVPIVLMAWKKHLMADQFGFPLNAVDYYPVAELGLYLTFAIGIAALANFLASRVIAPAGWRPASEWSFGDAAFLGAFGIHMANYFFSAIAKMILPGAGMTTWVLENRTHDIMLATWAIGLGPLQGTGSLAWAGHEFMALFAAPANAITLLTQLAGLICIARIRWAVVLTGIYDILHLVVFVTTSILFWKWMTLNVGLILALRHLLPRGAPPWPLIVMTIAVTLLTPFVFRVPWLGWFDSGALNKVIVEAEMESGERVELPNVYFLEGSAQLAKSVIGRPYEGHFEGIDVFGKASEGREQMVASHSCDLPVAEKSGLSQSFERNPRLTRYFRYHHDFVLSRAGADGWFNPWLFPHHNWAAPARYEEFFEIDVRNIRAYHYIVESVCLTYDGNGGVDERVLLKGSHEIRVD